MRSITETKTVPHSRIVANEKYLATPNILVVKSGVSPRQNIDHMLPATVRVNISGERSHGQDLFRAKRW